MHHDSPSSSDDSDEAYQRRILVHVSRTFALTIPQLPPRLCDAVTTAYLLCRAADTIEDEPQLALADKRHFLARFERVVAGGEDAQQLSAVLDPMLSAQTSVHERDLIANLPRVIAACRRLPPRSQQAIARCVRIMCAGMHHFQRQASLRGLPRLEDLDNYCYHVAGVVGEMLTELFCAYSPQIDARAATLHRLSPSFGQGLQMTNILKDVWEDRSRGACWLPQEMFDPYGVDLATLRPADPRATGSAGFGAGMRELIGIAHGHLRHALAFTLQIPARETGIRRFCGWSIGLALLTLRSILDNPGFSSGAEVKISRRQVMLVTVGCNLGVRSDRLLARLFGAAAAGLPLTALPPGRSWADWTESSQPREFAQEAALRSAVH